MWVVPGATQRYIKNKSVGVRDKTLGLILHVQAGNGELTGWYNNANSGASSCWQARKGNPNPIQYGDPDADKFWTQAAGNPDYGAVESEGYPNEPLDADQIEAIARIYAAGHKNEGWPFQLAEKPGERGLGWHGMGGKAWGNHPNCPGAIRKNQRGAILARARQIAGGSTTAAPQEDDMFTDADRALLQQAMSKADGNTIRRDLGSIRDQIRGDLSKMSAQQVADSIPDNLAQQVVDLLATRLKGA